MTFRTDRQANQQTFQYFLECGFMCDMCIIQFKVIHTHKHTHTYTHTHLIYLNSLNFLLHFK